MQLEESIYNLIPHIENPPPKPPLFKSRFKDPEPTKRAKGTMGPPCVERKDPHNFLRKREGPLSKSALPPSSPGRSMPKPRTEPRTNKPALPSKAQAPTLASATTKNFVEANKTEAIRDVTKKPAKEEENWFKKKDYGKRPDYLEKVREEMIEEGEYVAMLEKQSKASAKTGPKVRELPQEEKEDLIKALKAKWEKIHATYVAMPMTITTLSMKTKKEDLEAQLSATEKDIEALSKPHVYVVGEENTSEV